MRSLFRQIRTLFRQIKSNSSPDKTKNIAKNRVCCPAVSKATYPVFNTNIHTGFPACVCMKLRVVSLLTRDRAADAAYGILPPFPHVRYAVVAFRLTSFGCFGVPSRSQRRVRGAFHPIPSTPDPDRWPLQTGRPFPNMLFYSILRFRCDLYYLHCAEKVKRDNERKTFMD